MAPRLNLSKMQLSYLDFQKCNLTGSDFTTVIANETNFKGAKLNA